MHKKKKEFKEVDEVKIVEPKQESKLVALKDFVISHNDYFRKIVKGEDISDVPKIYIENLKTEGVIAKGE